jgi:site-specific recombinase XerD
MGNTALSELENEFRYYLLSVRAMSERSLPRRIKTFRRLARFLADRRVRSAGRVSLQIIYEFLEGCARGNSRRHAKTVHEDVRSILTFLHFTGRLRRDLAAHLIAPCVWRLANVPKAFSEKDTACMLASLRAETPYDHRERLVMLLFICYGLRLGEVTRLELGDFDVRMKTVTVRERKNAVPLVLPLLPAVEEALRGYLEHFRPAGLRTKRLFVTIHRRSRAPVTWQAIHEIIKRFLRRCGLEGSATKFRHTLATYLVNSGARLEAVQAVLGHRSSDSTRVYAKVHLDALREVADNYSMKL